MSWRAKAGREQKVLASIVARLFSFGDLAEDAAGRSPWMRWCILWAAWQANALLRDYVEGRAGNMKARRWSAVPMPAGFGSHPDDAQDLAASLSALARFMQAMAAHMCRLSFLQQGQASDEAGNEGMLHCGVLQRLPDAAASAVEFRDTS